MIWILAMRGASTKLRNSPFTETVIEGVHGVVYKPGVEVIAHSGGEGSEGEAGTFARGLHRISGFVFSYHGAAAETLLTVTAPIDLIVRYRANLQKRRRTFTNVLFAGDAAVTVPALNRGTPDIIGVPFRVQLPAEETLADHVIDTVDP